MFFDFSFLCFILLLSSFFFDLVQKKDSNSHLVTTKKENKTKNRKKIERKTTFFFFFFLVSSFVFLPYLARNLQTVDFPDPAYPSSTIFVFFWFKNFVKSWTEWVSPTSCPIRKKLNRWKTESKGREQGWKN